MDRLTHRFSERKVARWAIGYLAVSWGALQVLQLIWEVFEWPLVPLRVIIGAMAVGFPVIVAFAWMRHPPDETGRAEEKSGTAHKWHPVRAVASIAVVVGLLVGAGWTVKRFTDRHWAGHEAVLEIRRLAETGDFAAALELGEDALAILPDHPVVDSFVSLVSETPSIQTEPAGAEVFIREYADTAGPWISLGVTPLAEVRLPRGLKRWRISRAGFEEIELAGSASAEFNLLLRPEGSTPNGMVLIPGGTAGGFITGIGPLTELEYSDYSIDRYEVTNAAYLEFVEAGGYEREEFWIHSFMDGSRRLTWSEAMERLEDTTGRTGPATWEFGRPKPGEESLPVTGVSWYEAAAYAEFRGKSLPTLRHWLQASGTGMGGSIIPLSNLEGAGLAEPGTFGGMSPSGAFDMAGNAREWVLNSAGQHRHAVGGAWSDPSYFFSGPNVQPPLERLPVNGFRLALYTPNEDFEGTAEADMPLITRDYYEEQPVSDEVFRVFAGQFDYDPIPLDAVVEETLEFGLGTVERVSFEGVGWGRIHAYLYLPAEAEPPYQTVVWFPGSGAARLQPDPDPRDMEVFQHFVAGGRAVLWPVLGGTYSRAEADQPPGMNTTWPKPTREYVDFVRGWVSEVRRSIDYLETRPEIDLARLAYFGTSWGGRIGAIIPAVEPRFKVNLVMLGGLASGTALPEVDQINYVTRIKIPTLMLNGRHDPLEPVEGAQLPMLRLLGTPEADKRHVLYDEFGHGLPRNEMIRETLDWLDRYFGPPR